MRVVYFAALREAAGVSEESIGTAATTLKELFEELTARHHFRWAALHVRGSINGDWSEMAAPFCDGDVVVFIPPVAGG